MAVVAGALRDPNGRWLLQKRPPGKRHAGLWEFPGGKVEPGETPLQALARELNEELIITLISVDPEAIARARAPADEHEPAIVIELYRVEKWQGIPQAEPGAELGLFALSEIDGLPLPPLDRELAAALSQSPG